MSNKLLENDKLYQAYPKINEAIDNAEDAFFKSIQAVNTANSAKTKADSVQEQFNGVVLEGSIDPETAQARVDIDGVSFQTLKERLDSEQNKRRLQMYFINVDEFGAKGDGVTDDQAAIVSAINEASAKGGGRVFFPGNKRYKMNDVVNFLNVSDVTLDLQGSTLDFSSIVTSIGKTLVEFKGAYSTGIPLTASALVDTRVVPVDTTGFAAGDMVRVYSNKIWDSTRTNTRYGEIAFIESIDSSGQLTLTTELHATYTVSDAAKIEKLTPIKNIVIENGTVLGPSANDQLFGIHIQLGVNCLVRNIRSFDIDKRHIVLTDCVNGNVESCYIDESNHESQAYGVSFVDACRDCVASNNHFSKVRHSLSTNNNFSTSWGIVRRILFTNNTIVDSSRNLTDGGGGDAIDTHAGAEDIFIIGNNVYSSTGHGINFEARTGIIANNRIRNTLNHGIYVNPRSDLASSVIINDNFISNSIGDGVGSDNGINIALQTAPGASYVVSGNKVDSYSQAIRLVGASNFKCDRASITGNSVQVTGGGYGIHVDYVDNVTVGNNSVKAPDIGIFVGNGENPAVTGNSVRLTGNATTAWGIRLDSGVSYGVVSGNSLREAGTHTNSFGVVFQSTVTYSGAFNNVTQGFSTNVTTGGGTGNVTANNI